MQSFDRPADTDIPPSPWVSRFAHLVRQGGSVLDVAAGHGRHSNFFLERGHAVTAVDIDVTGLMWLEGRPGFDSLPHDLEGDGWPFESEVFAGIVVANYLHRPHFQNLIESLAPGGVVLVETFGQGNETLGRPRNPDFLLRPGELLEAFSGHLQIVAYECGREDQPRLAIRQRICAVKSHAPALLC